MADSISKSKLKAHMLRVFRDIEQSGEELIVTDHGRPVLKVTPLKPARSADQVFADVMGRVRYHEDLDTPTTGEWPQA